MKRITRSEVFMKTALLNNLYKTGLSGAIAILDVSSNLLSKSNNLKREDVINRILEIKNEMEIEWNNSNPDAKLLRNYIRGRIATCEDLLNKI